MKTVAFAISLIIVATEVVAVPSEQQQRPSNDRSVHSHSASAITQQIPPPSTTQAGPESLDELTHRVRKLELEMVQKNEGSKDSGAIIAAMSAIGVGVLALLGQLLLAFREDRRAARAADRAIELA